MSSAESFGWHSKGKFEMILLYVYGHGGESRDFKITTMAGTIEKPSIQVRLSLIPPLILARFAWVFEADTPEK